MSCIQQQKNKHPSWSLYCQDSTQSVQDSRYWPTRNHFWWHMVIHTPVLNTVHMTFTLWKYLDICFSHGKDADPQTLRTQPVASDWRRGARSDTTDHGNHMENPCSQCNTKMMKGQKISIEFAIELGWPLVGSNGHASCASASTGISILLTCSHVPFCLASQDTSTAYVFSFWMLPGRLASHPSMLSWKDGASFRHKSWMKQPRVSPILFFGRSWRVKS